MSAFRKKMSGFRRMITFDEASDLLKERRWNPIPELSLPVMDAMGLISSHTIKSEKDYPESDRSAVDGYAVDYRQTSGASEYNPVILGIEGEIEAGQVTDFKVTEGKCCSIFTGGILPEGANSVVMAEDTTRQGGSVLIHRGARKYENVSRSGEDISVGTVLVHKGSVIRAQHVASLIAAGIEEINAFRKIRLGILSTGNELSRDAPGKKIPNTTQPLLIGHFSNSYTEAVDLGVTGDSKEEIASRISGNMDEVDIVLVTGGSSLGEYDNVPEALESIGSPVFGGVLIKPGRTISLYDLSGKPAFSVSGLPVAALVSFEAFFEVYLRAILGIRASRPRIMAELSERVVNTGGMRLFLRVSVRQTEKGMLADPLRTTGSGVLSTLLRANGIVIVPENIQGIEKGEIVEVALIGDID